MEIYKGRSAQALMKLSRSDREKIVLRILGDDRLNFEAKLDNSKKARAKIEESLLKTRFLHPSEEINKILAEWVCRGTAERYVLLAQLTLMNSASYEDANI